MVDDRITDGDRIAALLRAEIDGRETAGLARLSIDGETVLADGRPLATLDPRDDGLVVRFEPGVDVPADVATGSNLEIDPAGSAFDVERPDDGVVVLESAAAVKRVVDALVVATQASRRGG